VEWKALWWELWNMIVVEQWKREWFSSGKFMWRRKSSRMDVA
jgi:hypothetical protein